MQAAWRPPAGIAHVTLSFIFSTTLLPPSSTQVNSNSPALGTFMKKDKNGLVAMPGCRSALNTSLPAKLGENELMMLRGMTLPSGSLRCPVSMTCEIKVLISIRSPTLSASGSFTRSLFMAKSLGLAAATPDRDLHGAAADQEPAIAELGQRDHLLGLGQTHAACRRGLA